MTWVLPLGAGAAGALAGAAGAGGGAWAGACVWLLLVALRTSMRHVGQVCCLWNQERRQLWGKWDNKTYYKKQKKLFGFLNISESKWIYLEWKMWLHGSFLAPVTISSRQMMQTLSEAWRSSGVASGYLWRIFSEEYLTNEGDDQTDDDQRFSLNEKQVFTHSVFMFRMALLDMIASVTAFLNCLEKQVQSCINNNTESVKNLLNNNVMYLSATEKQASLLCELI